MSETDTLDVASEFAALMSGAANDAAADNPNKRPDATDEAPYGYHPDGRPRRSNGGRPRKSPSVDELKAARAEKADDDGQAPAEDRAPESPKRPRLALGGHSHAKKEPAPTPQFREGQIARGINKLYRKAGKIVRVMDPDIGTALIEITRKDDEDDVTVGEAWEELARTNVRIRRFLLACISGGAWGQIFMVHAPVLLAVLMKENVRKHIPFMAFIESVAEPDDDTAPGDGGLPGGMTADDVREASRLAQEQMSKMGFPVTPEMAAMAESMFGGGGAATMTAPPAFARAQPRNTSRAQRKGHR